MLATTTQHPTIAARRLGYVIGGLVNLALLYAVNIWPGWEVVPFLTAETVLVLTLVNMSIVGNLVSNAVYLVNDRPWLKAFGTVVTTTVGMIALVRIWQVFPFDFGDSSFNWQLLTRILLIVSIVGSDIGIIVAFVSFVKAIAGRPN
jgi:hypothetical protein